MKIVFAGTSHFAIPALAALIKTHEVCAVYTKPDSPSGRGLRLSYSPVKVFVLDNFPELPILQPVNLKDIDTQRQLAEFYADIMVVIAYGLILPKTLFPLFRHGCINVHASLLPRWRGAAPIQRCLLAGDALTGVTIMQMNEGLDTGDILNSKSYAIQATDTAQTLLSRLAELGSEALMETLQAIEANMVSFLPQDDTLFTYARKITKEEALISWHDSAIYIARQVRAFNPWPVAYTYLNEVMLKVWEVEVVSMLFNKELSGTIIQVNERGIDVATGHGVIRLLRVQIPGKKSMPVREFLHARINQIIPGKTLLGSGDVDYS